MVSPAHSTNVWRRNLGHCTRQCTHCFLSLRSVTGAIPAALAFKWIRILYRCWKSRQCYDEPTYLAALKQRNSPINKFLYPTCQETQP